MKSFFVYILASKRNGTLYIGVTNDLRRRIEEHRSGAVEGFTKKYGIKTLVYFEQTDSAEAAIAREKQLKNWKRAWKIELIEKDNPEWRDLAEELFLLDSGSSPE
ncbi:GIY-YIG nuclease family protein [Candidatus Saccharibacteria bacterium]|jgi:Predicted endonuclease containing a URI domain|nr:GIY-YIG nuclease family protein [Candidatus Saccharibacteria bacterium]